MLKLSALKILLKDKYYRKANIIKKLNIIERLLINKLLLLRIFITKTISYYNYLWMSILDKIDVFSQKLAVM